MTPVHRNYGTKYGKAAIPVFYCPNTGRLRIKTYNIKQERKVKNECRK